MNVCHLQPRDVIIVNVEGNPVPCEVLEITLGTPGSLKLLDIGADRTFHRTAESLNECTRFNGQVPTLRGYSDFLKHNDPDVTVRFLPPSGHRRATAAEVTIHKPALSDSELVVAKALQGRTPDELAALLSQFTAKYLADNPKATIV